MISQMTYAFAREETAFKLMGKKIYNFNPEFNYFYKPLSQSIQTEHSKSEKIKLWTGILGYVVNIAHPDATMIFNFIILKISELMGDEYVNVMNMLLSPDQPLQQGKDQGRCRATGGGAQNQYGQPQGATEQAARGAF